MPGGWEDEENKYFYSFINHADINQSLYSDCRQICLFIVSTHDWQRWEWNSNKIQSTLQD